MEDPPRPRRRASKKVYARCDVTGKRRYRDGHDAALALRHLRFMAAAADHDGAAHRIRVVRRYACVFCGGWHLTSWARPPLAA